MPFATAPERRGTTGLIHLQKGAGIISPDTAILVFSPTGPPIMPQAFLILLYTEGIYRRIHIYLQLPKFYLAIPA